jgi:hypothetical protein
VLHHNVSVCDTCYQRHCKTNNNTIKKKKKKKQRFAKAAGRENAESQTFSTDCVSFGSREK